jgi:hypothetical protein
MRFTDTVHGPALPPAVAEAIAEVLELAAEACDGSGQTERADGILQARNIVMAMRPSVPGTPGHIDRRGACDWMFAIDPENPLPSFH